ncbi:XdhC family protein [Acidiphilium sp. PA]|uniref:XdhC family protein n=1 Tax=Acidiphilium sp. PA TaxID=2871705 RepID=UPI0022437589|nr:XdhC family protein [Acidiphilium sp. PA]MCW8307221.1 XdhC family protein [Acidiphilium sp. PA]
MKAEHLHALQVAAAQRIPVAFATRLPDGAAFILPDPAAPQALALEAAAMLAADRTGMVTIGAETWFIEARNPAPRAIIVGAVHIAQSLAPLAATMGFDVAVVDPRRAFASADRFPGVVIRTDWPDEALQDLRPDARTAIITLTHDPKLDDPALIAALATEAFYIGSLGSRKTHAARLDRLRAAGLTDATLARICAPVGLDIGAVTAPEIALSIIAQMVAARRGKPTRA